MLVGKGSLSFRTFLVSGKESNPGHQAIVNRLEKYSFSGIQLEDEGSQHGWVGPDHLFDGDFNTAKVFRGRYAVFALRIDTKKVSGPILQAHTAIAVQAALEAEDLEKLPARRKREIKLEVKRQLLAETPPAQKAYGVFWNVEGRKIHLQNTSKTVVEAFRSLFEQSFKCALEPLVPGIQAASYARENGLMKELKDARPLELTLTPELAMV